ncbi:tyrosine-type recombinase/integrase [Bacillus infantis]|uniref:Tyrosine-type recombinase/integrase n=1 Tax=Bacillus infantis TaxID=324767 RepID=A0A5D4RZG3_9BACI|nr:tyrosine-type recombinase/integrase [Bacillus infantis]TYS55761.1 tyrosine-type recombinase/integrase [Bacillus infantis]
MDPLVYFIEKGLREKGKSPKTIRAYQYALFNFEKWLQAVETDLENFGRSDVQQYIDELADNKKSAATINSYFAAIRSFARFYERPETVSDIRIVKTPNLMKEAPVALEKNERQRIKREIDRTGHKRDIAIILTLLYTGIRVSELVNLDIDDVEASERKGSLTVRHGKGNKPRKLPLHPEVRRALRQYIDERTDEDPALFLSTHKKRISVRSVQHLCNKYGVNPHKFRHTLVTNLVDQGQDDETIRTITGHEHVNMIARYRSVREEDKEAAISSLYMD